MRSILAAIIFLCLAIHTGAQNWEQTNGPEGGSFSSVCVINNNLLASTYSGSIFQYNGSDWSYRGNNGLYIYDLVSIGNTLFAQNGDRVSRSSNEGKTWTEVLKGYEPVIYKKDSEVYISANDTIYISKDEGETWDNALTNYSVNTILFGDSVVQDLISHRAMIKKDSTFFLSCMTSVYPLPLGIFITHDNGKNWIFPSGLPDPIYVNSFAVHNNEVYLGSSHGVYRSTDNGMKWTEYNSGLINSFGFPNSINQLIVYDNKLYASVSNTDDYVFALNNGVWTSFNMPLYPTKMIENEKSLLISTNKGIYSYENSWHDINNGLYAARAHVYALKNDLVYAVAFSNELFKTTDKGESWIKDNSISAKKFIKNGEKIYSIGGDGIHVSDDNGSSWASLNSGLPSSYINSISDFVIDNNIIYLGFSKGRPREHLPAVWEAGGFYRSIDGGSSWQKITGGLPHSGPIPVPIYKVSANNAMLITQTTQGTYVSFDEGISWQSVGGLPEYYSAREFANLKDNILIGSSYGVHVLNKNSAVVDSFNTGLTSDPLFRITAKFLTINDQIYLVGKTDSTLSYKLNGDKWEQADLNLPDNFSFYNFSSVDNTVYAAVADLGIWKADFNSTTDINDGSIVKDFVLNQNYPNPFNPATKISWHSPSEGQQTIKVFDMLGNEVAVLVDEFKPAGSYVVEFNASQLSSGVYFYRIKSGNFSDTKKMILMK